MKSSNYLNRNTSFLSSSLTYSVLSIVLSVGIASSLHAQGVKENGVTVQIWENAKQPDLDAFLEDKRYKNENPNRTFLEQTIDLEDMGDHYVTQSSAILKPLKDGDYTFYLAGDDIAQLWFCEGEAPDKLQKIIDLTGYTAPRAFSNRGKSAPIPLKSGKPYYIRVLHKEKTGGDHVSLAWEAKGMSRDLIDAKYLKPATDGKKQKALEASIALDKETDARLKELLAFKNGDLVAWLDALPKPQQAELDRRLVAVQKAIGKLPDKDKAAALTPYVRLARLLVPSEEKPIAHPVAKRLLYMESYALKELPPDRIAAMGAHRLAQTLGAISDDAKPGIVEVQVSSSPEKWCGSELVSTGFYALPGKAFTLTVPAALVTKDAEVQIGHHNNAHEKSALVSMPETTLRFPIKEAKDKYVSPHGGLVFIRVPKAVGLDKATLKAEGVIKAPRFILGETSDEQWKTLRQHLAPWGELVSERLVLIVPRDQLLALDKPTEIMAWWNENNRRHEDFYGYDPKHPFRMHAMLYARQGVSYWPLEWQSQNMIPLLDIEQMKTKNSALYLHEHGHHDDFGQMEIGFTSESTCNWAGYYMKEIEPFDWKDSHDTHLKKLFNPDDAAHNEIKQKDWYKISTKGTHHWSYPVTSMMIGYAEDFTWKNIRDFLHRYRNFDGDPLNQHAFLKGKFDDQAKIDRYLIGLSEQAKRDVRPYFAHFDYLPSDGAKAYLDSLKLPAWDAIYLPIPEVTTTASNTPLVIKDVQKSLLTMAKNPEIILDGQPAHGKAELKDGNLVYTPNPGFKGKDAIPYILKNNVGTSPKKTLTITVE